MGFAMDEKTTAEVLRQVEFYFSDSNLPGDKFLRRCLQKSDDGLISLPLICTFGRMKSHLKIEGGPNAVPADVIAAVAEVLRKSTFLRVSDDGQKVGRATSAKLDEILSEVSARSIAAGPLRSNVTLDEVEKFFAEHAKVNCVRLPRHPTSKAFCGSAVVELASEEEAKRVMDLKLSFDGTELEIKSKKDFDLEMEKLQEESKRKRVLEFEYPKGLLVAFSLRKVGNGRETKDSKEEGTEAISNRDETVAKEESIRENKKEDENQISREDLKAAFGCFGTIKYIDFYRGETCGYLRFEDAESVIKARTAAITEEAGGITVKDSIATLQAVEGDVERDYWLKLKNLGRSENGRGRNSSRGGRGRGKSSRDRFQRDRSCGDVNLGKHQRVEESNGAEGGHESKQIKTGAAS